MTVGDLKRLLEETDLPDHAPVFIETKYSYHETRAEPMACGEVNQYGQAQNDGDTPNALVFLDMGN